MASSSHEPIISDDDFAAAQKRLDEIKAVWGYKARPTYELKDWLSGLVRCSECGATLTFTKPHYFKCNNYVRGRCKSSQHINVDLLHEAVLDRLKADISSPHPLSLSISRSGPSHDDLTRLRTMLNDLRRRDSRLLDAYLSGTIGLDQFTMAKRALDAQIKDAEDGIAEKEAASTSPERITAALSESIRQAYNTLIAPDTSLEDKNMALRSITDRITFDKSTMSLDIIYRFIF